MRAILFSQLKTHVKISITELNVNTSMGLLMTHTQH